MAAKQRRPHFFKVLLGDFKERLRIPPNFLRHISNLNSLTLQGPSGRHWHVELARNKRETILASGWQVFVEDHSLKECEFLVFKYYGNKHFKVLIFDKTACEREDVFDARPPETSKKSEEPSSSNVKGKQPMDLVIVKSENSDSDYSDMQLDNHFYGPKPLQIEYTKQSEEAKTDAGDIQQYVSSRNKWFSKSTRRPVTQDERTRAQMAASAFCSQFPYVTMCMKARQVYTNSVLRLPVHFTRKHLPRKRLDMILEDPSGKPWPIIYIPISTNGFSGGWAGFARGNNLEEGDYCVFELVAPTKIRVHIFRVVEEISPPIRVSSNQWNAKCSESC